MNSVKSIRKLLSKLTNDEINILYRNLYYSNEDKNQNLKLLNLLKLLLSENNYSYVDIQNILYTKINYYAFNKLINRLKIKIYNILLLDNSILSNNFSDRNKILLELKTKLIQADILQLKGLRKYVLTIYNNIISRSNKYELYEIKLQALISKQRLISLNTKRKEFENINAEIKYSEFCYQTLKNANNIYKAITNKIEHSHNFMIYDKELAKSIIKLKYFYNKLNSKTISFYLNTLNAQHFQNRLNYIKSQKSLEIAKNILINSKSVFTDNRYGGIILNLSNNCIYNYQFNNSIKYANESKYYFKSLPFTLKIVDEILFYSYFYLKKYDACLKLLNSISSYDENEIIKNKFIYFKACVLFCQKDFESCVSELANYNDNELYSGSNEWNINKRILIIITLIELEKLEELELQIQNLDRLIKRLIKRNIINKRYVLILKIIIYIIRSNYNYNHINLKKIKYINFLNSDNGQYKWHIKSPELIVFTDWLRSKISNSNINESIIERAE